MWHPDVGDCRQELVFIGIGIDEIALYDSLEDYLLTDQELESGPSVWRNFADPFPAWNVRRADDSPVPQAGDFESINK
ncbi:MAG: GTP-binding protein [bacterium]|nr:GTP-binding protein [bacterium]